MVRTHHHDSSQLSAALFGGGDNESPFPPPRAKVQQQQIPVSQTQSLQRRNSDGDNRFIKEDQRAQWEMNHTRIANNPFCNNDSNPKMMTQPYDKPPEVNQPHYGQFSQQNQRYLEEQQRGGGQPVFTPQNYQQQQDQFPYMKQSLHPESQTSIPMQEYQQQYLQPTQHQQQLPLQLPYQQIYAQPFQQQQSSPLQQQKFLQPNQLQPPMTNGGMFLPSPPGLGQYYPMHMPLRAPGYENGPVYLVMPPQMPLDGSRRISTSAPNVNEMALQSLSSASSMGSSNIWNGSPEPMSNPSTGSLSGVLSRAKWSEKGAGVGVGRPWNSEEDEKVSSRGRDPAPPQWASKEETNVLPGMKGSGGERTHARGPVVLNSQEMAEKQRRQRQAQETQRIIQQQLEEKKRIQSQEEDRDRKEAEMWEEKMKAQQQKERMEIEAEEKKKKDKEEMEDRRQESMRIAIRDAAEKARREKDEARYGKSSNVTEISSESKEPQGQKNQTTAAKKMSVSFNLSEQEDDTKEQLITQVPQTADNKDQLSPKVEENTDLKVALNLPDVVSTAHVSSLDPVQKLALLTALGINPEYLLSSGVFDKSTFMTLLGPSQDHTTEDSSQYIRNVMLTPTKFRNARDFGVQCDETTLSKGHSERKLVRRRLSRRQKSKESSDNSSSYEKPQWGRHKSDRPYRKQSEKDPYVSRRFRKKHTRSVSTVSDGKESLTDPDSDNQLIAQPRRRKTWGESLQEVISSDGFSRSPSPRRHRGDPDIFIPRGPPSIKRSLTPNIQQDRLHGSPHLLLSPDGTTRLKTPESVIKTSSEPESFTESLRLRTHDGDKDIVTESHLRPNSPPVPAISGIQIAFNVFKYYRMQWRKCTNM